MPRRLALCLLIAWLAWIPMVSAQGPGPQGSPGPGFYSQPQGSPGAGQSAPMGYELQPSLYEQLLPATRGSYDLDPLMDLGIAETISRSWVRTEYLWMNFRDPSVPFLGATPAVTPPATFNPNNFVPAFDRVTGSRLFQEGQFVNLNGANNQGVNGLRVTV